MINTHTHAYSGVDRVTTSTPGHDYRDAESLPYTIADLQLEFPITPTHVMRYCRRQDWYHLIGLATGDKCCGWWQGGGVVTTSVPKSHIQISPGCTSPLISRYQATYMGARNAKLA